MATAIDTPNDAHHLQQQQQLQQQPQPYTVLSYTVHPLQQQPPPPPPPPPPMATVLAMPIAHDLSAHSSPPPFEPLAGDDFGNDLLINDFGDLLEELTSELD
jgi:hypothetical protein